MKIAVIQFSGSNCDLDAVHVLKNVLGMATNLVWHKFFKNQEYDAVVLPGGFSYGDYLRSGIIASHSPALNEIKEMVKEGRPVLGICNGFQILIESEILRGALLPNDCLKFVCRWVALKCESSQTAFTGLIPEGRILHMPIAHREGRYFNTVKAVKDMEAKKQIVFRYVDEEGKITQSANPNGSIGNISGVCNDKGNVLGLMPHPERASETILSPHKDCNGLVIFQSMIDFMRR